MAVLGDLYAAPGSLSPNLTADSNHMVVFSRSIPMIGAAKSVHAARVSRMVHIDFAVVLVINHGAYG